VEETLRRLESVFLLFLIHHGVVHPLAFGVRPFLRARARLSVFGHHAPCGHHRLSTFFGNCLDGVRINTFQYNRISLRQTSDHIILAVESGAEFKVNGLAFGVGAMDCELQAVGLGFNLERAVERSWAGNVFRLGQIEFPGANVFVGCLGNRAKDEQQRRHGDSEQRECSRSHDYLLLALTFKLSRLSYHHRSLNLEFPFTSGAKGD
jgi:hypothetical protein